MSQVIAGGQVIVGMVGCGRTWGERAQVVGVPGDDNSTGAGSDERDVGVDDVGGCRFGQ